MKFRVVIPARYASSRLPAKPLLDLGGKPMVVRVAERALQSGAAEVVVATDHPEVQTVVNQHGIDCVETSVNHRCGTERLAEVVAIKNWADDEIIVNVQGDEPLIDPAMVFATAQRLYDTGADIATLAHPIHEVSDFVNPNIVKVVCKADGDALYFSRAPIPYARDQFAADGGIVSLPPLMPVYRHIGLYAYRAHFLKKYSELAASPLEIFESLEQLRALWHGYRISVLLSDDMPPAGVDTPEDAERVKAVFAQLSN